MRTLFSALICLLVTSAFPCAGASLLVSSYETGQVLRYDSTTGAFLGPFPQGLFGNRPAGLTLGPNGDLFVGVNNFGPPFQSSILRFNATTGDFLGTFASGGGLNSPERMVFGPDGNLYVASFGGTAPNSSVLRYNGVTGTFIDAFVPVGSGGLSGAEGIAFGPDGNLYVTSRTTNQVLRYSGTTGAFLGVFATGGNNGPVDLTFGPDGNLYVLASSGAGSLPVLRFNGTTGASLGAFGPTLMGAGADGTSLTFGPDRNLYVTTGYLGNSVVRLDGTTGAPAGVVVSLVTGGLLNYATSLLFLPQPVPEPGTFVLLGIAAVGLGCYRFRRVVGRCIPWVDVSK